jgi:ubiquinone/menaquinone biosynthesis C-methylase UbiE
MDVPRTRLPDADLRVGEMEDLRWEDDTFDLVTGFNSFFFANDMVAALREAGRVVKAHAPIVIQVWGARTAATLK